MKEMRGGRKLVSSWKGELNRILEYAHTAEI